MLILSRVREAYEAGSPTKHAVEHGIRATASVVSAAIVMVGVFAIFATLGWVDFKMMGVALAVAVLLDATIVRAVLLPATRSLLGDWNWYLPRRWIGCHESATRRRRQPPKPRSASRSASDASTGRAPADRQCGPGTSSVVSEA